MSKRDTYKYELKDGNKVLYVGITNDPERREQEHRQNKEFGHMNVIGNRTTRNAAENWEENRIGTYMNNHGGKTPPLNKNETGK